MNNTGMNPFVLRARPPVLRRRSARRLPSLHVAFARRWWQWRISADEKIKRAFDIAFSAVVLVCISPLLALIALGIKLEDGGPVFFKQVRVGRHGREFLMFKDDPRITRLGKWLRKFSLDELPQFWNVLIGDMSVVGPRPPVPREVALYTLADRRRLAVAPGITCIWQVSGRAQIDFHGQVELDVRYIETRGFWSDLGIISKTLPAVISGSGAY
jgi:lipopolysaccharide/colanic/teichoic acid biosynthesis glycosyltransferase